MWKRRRISPKSAPASIRPLSGWVMARTAKIDGAAIAPSASSPPTQTTSVKTARRPDINERYNLGGWPTTALLTPDGDVITGGTFVASDRMVAILTRVASISAALTTDPRDHSDHTDRRATEYTEHTDLSGLTESIFSAFDPEHGGFGIEPKFPHTAPL